MCGWKGVPLGPEEKNLSKGEIPSVALKKQRAKGG